MVLRVGSIISAVVLHSLNMLRPKARMFLIAQVDGSKQHKNYGKRNNMLYVIVYDRIHESLV